MAQTHKCPNKPFVIQILLNMFRLNRIDYEPSSLHSHSQHQIPRSSNDQTIPNRRRNVH